VDSGLVNEFDDYSEIEFGTKQGGKILLSDPDDESKKIGEYTVLTTFLGPLNTTTFEIDCYGWGAYQFGTGQQIAFVSPCAGLPYFTVTGGQGEFFGAKGYVEFMIPDPHGSIHEIHICSTGEPESLKID